MLYIICWYAASDGSFAEPWLNRKPTNNAVKQHTFLRRWLYSHPQGTVHWTGGLWPDFFLSGWLGYMPFSSTGTGQGEGKCASLCRILSCGCCCQKYALSSWAGFIAIYLQLLSLPSSTLKVQLTKCLWKCYYLPVLSGARSSLKIYHLEQEALFSSVKHRTVKEQKLNPKPNAKLSLHLMSFLCFLPSGNVCAFGFVMWLNTVTWWNG